MVEYDYVIVGAGSAGCVLANRLTADGDTSVLVLEAGKPDNDWLIRIPLGVGKVWVSPKYNWDYTSEPEPHVDGRQIWHPRGKVLGGSSSINMMAYVRGHRGDYDRWRQMGLTGWGYADVLPYFKRMEAFELGEDAYRGVSGALRTKRNDTREPWFDAVVEAGKAAGYKATDDYNGAEQEGFARMQFSIGGGRRCSAAVAYLHPAMKRPNLTVETSAHATRVVFEGNRAVGIAYRRDGKDVTVRATREVILSGGAYNSPHLLMLSGVGPADHLREMGIDPLVDHKGVGANLRDHPAVAVETGYDGPTKFHNRLRFDQLVIGMLQAQFLGTGPATLPPGAGTAFIKSRPEYEIPDMQMFFRPLSLAAREWFPGIKPAAPQAFTMRTCQLRPESRGEVRLASNDPFKSARVLNNFLSTETDRRSLRDAVKIMRDIVSQAPLDKFRGSENMPGDDVRTDDDIDAYVRKGLGTVYHPIGTCRMGPDQESVVDMDFRVRGCGGLRVIDASVMPDLVGGNINAPVLMVAEKASDIILGNPPPPAADI